MSDFKLQLGCLVILLYFIVNYVKETSKKTVGCSPYFDAIIIVAPWAVILDGLTAYTVNHRDCIPDYLNIIFHGAFLAVMSILTSVVFIYMMKQTIGFERHTMKKLMVPGLFVTIAVLVFINKIYFVDGEITDYSMGIPVYICFASVFLHYLNIAVVVFWHRRTIEKRKQFSIGVFMLISVAILVTQLIFPEILITSLLPTMTVVSIYIYYENPSIRRLHTINADMVEGFSTLVENRDDSTGGHIHRTKAYVGILLDDLWKISKYRSILTKDYTRHVVNAAPMHDIGKIATPDYILKKPGKLEPEEYEEMKKHSAVGSEIIKKLFAEIKDPEYEKVAYEMTRYHHEKWNGKGYPDGLKGEEIPIHARIMAIADVFDAVSAKRVYRDAMPLSQCFKIIEDGAGTDFDPMLVSLFLDAKDEIIAYYNESKEKHDDLG